MSAALSGIVLRNFRSFSNETKVHLRPITLLYGQNSAGKSSIIKALLLLQQSLSMSRRRGRDSTFVFTGESVDLGSFQATVSGHMASRRMSIGIETIGRQDGELWRGPFTTTWTANEHGDSRSLTLEVAVHGEKLRFERHPHLGLWLLTRDSVPGFLNIVTTSQDLFTQNDDMFENLRTDLGYLPEFAGQRFPTRLLPGLVPPNTRNQWMSSATAGDYRFDTSDDRRSNPLDGPLMEAWEKISRTYWNPSRAQIESITHLGPLRQEPLRFDRYSPTEEAEVGATGSRMLSLLSEQPGLVTKVNDYLSLMDLPYTIKVGSLGSAETVGRVIYLALVNRKTGLELSPNDVGFGYSQVLPLITQSVLARNQLVCVEQPELHLHPAMQAKLGDLFISEATDGSRTRFLIETHSESLMLRILRRIREGHIKPEDVQVVYIDQNEEGIAEIHHIPIDNNGDFTSAWPKGFFDERLEEFGF